MTKHTRTRAVIICLILAVLLAAVTALTMGAVRIRTGALFSGFLDSTTAAGRILWYVRLPRLLAGLLAGTALAVSGFLVQTVLTNPLASPGTIGVNAGAGLAAAICMTFFPERVLLFPLAAFAGALITLLCVYTAARKSGASRMTLVLAGIAISSLLNAGISTLVTLYPDIMGALRDFQNGGFSGVTTTLLAPAAAVILPCVVLVLVFSPELEILSLGEPTALSLGLHVRGWRFVFLVLAAALAGAAVSFGGLIGFVGLIIPHIVRLLLPTAGTRTRAAACALLGAAFLVLCDTAARVIFAPFELPVGILIAYLGVPFFLWLLFRERRKRHD